MLSILGMNTNEIVAYVLVLSFNLEQVSSMLDKAFRIFFRLIFHSDQVWQYKHKYFRKTLKEPGII